MSAEASEPVPVPRALRPRRFRTANQVYRLKGGTEDNDLWIERIERPGGEVILASVWELSEDDRRAVAEGANVALYVWGTEHPPVSVELANVTLGRGGG